MSKPNESMMDKLERRLRDMVKDLERLFNPQAPKRAPVPIPVRNPRRDEQRSPYVR